MKTTQFAKKLLEMEKRGITTEHVLGDASVDSEIQFKINGYDTGISIQISEFSEGLVYTVTELSDNGIRFGQERVSLEVAYEDVLDLLSSLRIGKSS